MEYKFNVADLPLLWYNIENPRLFVNSLKQKWDDKHDNSNVFRYNIKNIQERVIVNKYLLMLNPERGYNRRKAEQFCKVSQKFDVKKFNFTKVSKEELLFKINEKHVILINVSPISRYHSLFCPSVDSSLEQVVTEESLKLVIELFFLCQDRDMRIGFNSLCALASVNHLHYHLMFEKFTLPCEYAKGVHVAGSLFLLNEYPVPAFCFQVLKKNEINEIAKNAFKLLNYLIENDIAHNLLITRGQNFMQGSINPEILRIIIWPRTSCSGVKQFSAFNIALCELSGWFPVFDENSFQKLNCHDLESELKQWKLNWFPELVEKIKHIFD